MVTMKVSFEVHTAVKLLKKRYATDKKQHRLYEILWLFIKDKDPELAAQAERIGKMRAEIEDLLGDDEGDNE